MDVSMTYKAEGRLEMLKERSKRCLCRHCGGALEVKSIMFNDYVEARVELYCPKCDRIEFGVEPEIYQSAKYFMESMDYNCFPELDDNETTRMMTIAKLCDIMSWQDKALGIIDDRGFTVPIKENKQSLGESSLFYDEDLE